MSPKNDSNTTFCALIAPLTQPTNKATVAIVVNTGILILFFILSPLNKKKTTLPKDGLLKINFILRKVTTVTLWTGCPFSGYCSPVRTSVAYKFISHN